MNKDNVKYVTFLPMSENDAQRCFRDIVPEDLDNFILTRQSQIKDEMMEAKTIEKLHYLKGRYKGLGEFRDMIAKFAKAKRKEEKLRAYRSVAEVKDKIKSQGGLIINKKQL